MENYFMNYDPQTGEIKGFYLKSIHGVNIPEPTIEITVEKHDFYMSNNGKYKIDIITFEDIEVVTEPLQLGPTLGERMTLLENAMDELLLGGGL